MCTTENKKGTMNDNTFMKEALYQANIAYEKNEVPVGAVIVKDGKIISRGYNLRETNGSAVSHAEICAIEDACKALGTWRLDECVLYVTLEPCPMCSGAIINSRIKKVVFGAKDNLAGCCGSVLNMNNYPFNHSFEIVGGIMETECAEMLSDFFKKKRNTNKSDTK